MSRLVAAAVLALVLTATASVPVGDASAVVATAEPEPQIVGLLPNPVAADDAGEYVRPVLPAGNWTLSDGESTVRIRQNRSGSVVVTADPDAVFDPPDGKFVARGLSLSNGGERIELRRAGVDGPVADAVEYGRAPEGERWLRGGDPRWRPVGFTPREAVDLGPAEATVFVLPDAPEPAVEPIRDAESRVFLAGYTFASERVTAELLAAHRRGVEVRVLLDGGPVGGITTEQARLLDRLVAGGIEVRVVAGPHARVRYHHAKYAVADDSAVVLTENWKPSGTGGADSRGWGVVLDSPRAADALATLFRDDAGWHDAVAWTEFRTGRTFTDDPPSDGSYPAHHPPASVRAERVTLLTAPGNAEAGVVSVIDDADERVDLLPPTVEDGPMLAATRRAAERGVAVRLLLSNAWYVAEENRAIAQRLNGWADRAGVPLEARVADPNGRFGKVHAKGVVADDTAVVGSLNWNPTSARENREVVVAMEGEAVADYYRGSFEADWRGAGAGRVGFGDWYSVPPALAITAVGAAAGVVLSVRRRFEFDADGDDAGVDDADSADDGFGPIG